MKSMNKDHSDFTVGNLSLFVFRSALGWHFLYEGISKLIHPGWSSASYLSNAGWLLSSIFNWIPSSPAALHTVDFLNIYGLIIIGLGLMLGIFVRAASLSGAFLLMLYYMANPPFMNLWGVSEGNYMIMDKNLIEMCALVLLAFLKNRDTLGLEDLYKYLKQRRTNRSSLNLSPEPTKTCNSSSVSRREILSRLAVLPVLGVFTVSLIKRYGIQGIEDAILSSGKNPAPDANSGSTSLVKFAGLQDLKEGEMPRGNIGGKKMSRLIFGGNLINGQAHARDLVYVSPLIQSYFTNEKILNSWKICEECGIDTMTSWPSKKFMDSFKEHRRRGGKIQWLGHVDYDNLNDVKTCIDNGAIGLYFAGDSVEKALVNNDLDKLGKMIAYTKQNGLFTGAACHTIKVPVALEEQKLDADFYMKTIHLDTYWSATPKEKRLFNVRYGGEPNYNARDKSSWYYNDNMWCIDADETIQFMKNLKKPWIGFKVLAAGAIKPEDGFRYAFESGADFVHVGIFDFQIVQNVNYLKDILSGKLKREREWMA